MTRVLQVIASVSALDGGPAEAALNLNRTLPAGGIDAVLVSTDQHANDHLPQERRSYIASSGVKAELYRSHWPFRIRASLPLATALWQRVRQADVVHLHGFYVWPALLGGTFARLHRVPYIVQPHGVFEPYQEQQSQRIKSWFMRLGGRKLLANAAAIAFDTETERRAATLPEAAADVPRLIIAPAPSGQVHPPRERTYDTAQGPHLLFLARIAPKKRVDLVIKAMPEILRRYPNARLSIAGADTEHLAANALRHILPEVRKAIDCCGFVEGQAKDDLLNSADIYVLPSENENFGISVTEALAAGVPVIISQNVAVWQQVRAHQAGIVLDHLETAEIVDAVEELMEDADRLRTASRAAVELGGLLFSADTTRHQALQAYAIALGQDIPPASSSR